MAEGGSSARLTPTQFLPYPHCRYMNATIQKWGNSLAVRIPQAVARQIRVEEGDAVELSVDAETMLVRPARPRYKLGQLLRRVTPANRTAETNWGKPQGQES